MANCPRRKAGAGARKSALGVSLLLMLTLAGIGSQAGQQSSKAPRSAARSPKITTSTRHDVTPPLRSVAPVRPARGKADPEMHRPRRLLRAPKTKVGRGLPDPVVQSAPAASNMPSSSQNFEGVSNVNGVLPPDTNGAAGPNHYVQWVNLSFAIYDKSGNLLYGPADGSTLWGGFGGVCEFSNDGDPIVLHDDLADRWMMSQLAIPNFPFGPFYQCIAVSQTADPTGAYYRYEFIVSGTKLNDYPKFGVWTDAYYMAVNQFDGFTQAFTGQGVVAFERDMLLSGRTARMVYFDLFDVDPNLGGMLPAHVEGVAPPPGAPNVFVLFDDDSGGYAPQDRLQLWRFHVDWANPSASTFTGPTILATAPFDSSMCQDQRNCIPQPGTTRKVDAISDRLMYRLQYRNFGSYEALVVNHTVDVGADHAGIRWYEIRDPQGTPVIYQQGTYAPDSNHRWMGSIAMDRAGNMGLGFSVASSNTYPSIRYTGRLAGDAPGTMGQGETELIAGSGSQTDSTGRWGDYSAMSVDPADQCTFWYTQEYYSATSGFGWRTRVGAFAFPGCATNLPSVTVVATAPNAAEAGLVNGTITVSRTGSTGSDLTVNYAVTGTATPGSDYVPLGGSSVTIPAGSASATIVVTPIDDASTELDETVVLTLSPSSVYQPGSPSSATVFVVNDDLPADFVVTALAAPTSGGAGASITVTDTTKNQGGGAAEATTTRFYLSTNTVLDVNDVTLGERALPALAAEVADSASTTLTIPAGTTGGNYYILAQADAENVVAESAEENNVKYSPILIGADLVVTVLTAPATAGAGTSITVTDTTKNQAGGAAPATTTRFYLSTNPALDASDVTLGERAVPALAPGATNSASTALTIPAGIAGGTYYLLAQADADGVAAETVEGNNMRYTFLQIGPDLLVTVLTAPATAGAGTGITVTDTTKNQGAGAAGASTTRFFLSTNAVVDASDVALGERAVPALAIGATHSSSTALSLPAGITGGSYFLLAQADADNAVAETVEGNNTKYATIQIGPDLTVSVLTAPASAGTGESITVTDTAKNQGGGAADASTTRFYLSTNTLVDASDALLGERAVPALSAGASHLASTVVAVPAGLAGGSYYLLAQADADNVVMESVEGNNVKYASIQIGPDLIVTVLTAPAAGGAGASITVTDTAKNRGGGAAGTTTTRFYLSTNTLVDAGDLPLGARTVPALAAGATHSASTVMTIPAGMASGSYYLLALADADNAVAESVEGNNTKFAPIQIGADLMVSALTAPATGGAGASITFTDTTKNQGGGAVGATTTRFYLSTNTLPDAGDVPLGERAVPALAAGATHSASTAVTIPAGTTAGNYYLLAQADADNVVAESVEGNNVNYAFIRVGPDLFVSALTAPTTAGAGASITVTDTTKNQGGGAAGATTTRFYLSADTLVDASDAPLGARAVPALAAGVTQSASTVLSIPAGTASGSYYLLAQADADGAVPETIEGNNVKYASIQVGPDLFVSVLTVPTRPSAGASITVTDTTSNLGGGAAGASTTRFYLSTNTLVDASDVLLGERAVPALAPGASHSASTVVTIPASTAGGNYYILAKADADGAVVESVEANNVKYAFIQIIGAGAGLTAPPLPGAMGTLAAVRPRRDLAAPDSTSVSRGR